MKNRRYFVGDRSNDKDWVREDASVLVVMVGTTWLMTPVMIVVPRQCDGNWWDRRRYNICGDVLFMAEGS